MNSKNIWIIIAVIAVIAIGFFMWQGAENKIDDEPIVPIDEEVDDESTEGDIGKMNDDIFVEIAAWSTYYSQTDMENWITHMEDLYNQYDITEENLNAYADLLEQDTERSIEVAEKYSDRLTELLEVGE
jgi:hypothetical protein